MLRYNRKAKMIIYFILFVLFLVILFFAIEPETKRTNQLNIIDHSENVDIDKNGNLKLNLEDFTHANQEQEFSFTILNDSSNTAHVSIEYNVPSQYINFVGLTSFEIGPGETYTYKFSIQTIKIPDTETILAIQINMKTTYLSTTRH